MKTDTEMHGALPLAILCENLGVRAPSSSDLHEILAGTPSEFRHISHYALVWGIGDDILRSSMVEKASEGMRQNLKWLVDEIDSELDEWLAGPESYSSAPSKAYRAFTAMRMAADEIPRLNQKLQ